jgi:hypothetical protein
LERLLICVNVASPKKIAFHSSERENEPGNNGINRSQSENQS